MSNLKVVGIGKWIVSNDPEDILRTYALGSCVALVLQHPATKTTGLVHVALPNSIRHPGADRGQGYYADTTVPALLNEMRTVAKLYMAAGSGMFAKLAGGAKMLKIKPNLNIGNHIVQEMEHILRKHQIPIPARDTGGEISRTVSAHVDSGKIIVSSPEKKEKLL